jgi:hypothetical protein
MLPMKRRNHNFFLTATLATILFGLTATRLAAETITVNGDFSGSMTTQGQSGGGVNSNDCGFVPSTPQETIQVTEKVNYLRLSVESGSGNPTLLVDGPDGRFCLLADSGKNPSLSGIWMPGEYKVYVGDEQGQQNQYTLRLSTER